MRYHHFGSGRYVLRLDPGEEVVSSITAFAVEAEVAAGWVTAIGSLDHAVLGFLDPKEQVYLKRTFDERMEIGHIGGSMGVSADDGRPIVHLHAVLSPRELLAYAGHLHEGKSGVVVECLVISMGGKITRVVDPESGFTRLVLPGESEGASPRAVTPRPR